MSRRPRWGCLEIRPLGRVSRILFVHILPIDDLQEHRETASCWCKPTAYEYRERVIISHNAKDGRDLLEHGERIQ